MSKKTKQEEIKMSSKAPRGAMSSPFSGMGDMLGNSGAFDVSGTTQIKTIFG